VLCFGGNARERKAQALLGFPVRGRGEVRNEEWAVLEPLLRLRQRADGRGRPPQDQRTVPNGVLWILRTRRSGGKGRKLRRYERRWYVERLLAWLP
jgi:hypothetical protein